MSIPFATAVFSTAPPHCLLSVWFLAAFVPPLSAQVQIEAGQPFQVVPFAAPFSGSVAMPAFPEPGDPNFTAYFYTLAGPMSARDLVAYNTAGVATTLVSIPVDFGYLNFGRGSTFGRLFVAEQGLPSGVPDGIYEISSALTLSPFNLMGGGNPDPNDVEFPGGAFGNDVFVANPSVGSGSASFHATISRLTPGGSFVSVLHTDAGGPYFMAASSGGPFGTFVYCSYYYNSTVDRIDPIGTASPFANLGAVGSKIAFGLGGAFGNDLYGANQLGELYRIDATGNAVRIATGLGADGEFAFDPQSGDMIVRDSGFVRITGVSASCTVRNGTGINPVVCACASLPVLGTTWNVAVGVGPTPTVTFAFASENALPGLILPFGEALIAPPVIEIPGNGTHSAILPNNPQFLGYLLFVQGVRVYAVGPTLRLDLTNALDVVVGF